MKSRTCCLILLVCVLSAVCPADPASVDTAIFYVSRDGNDAWSGKLPAPNVQVTDGPFATLERARAAVRGYADRGIPVSVAIRGGAYSITRSLVLDSTDSGSNLHPTIWRAFPGESVRLMGGISIGGFRAIRDPEVRSRLTARQLKNILVTDLTKQGVMDVGVPPNHMNLFYRGSRMNIARYPDRGWVTIASVPMDDGPVLNPGDKKVIKNGLPAGRHCGKFRYSGNRPSRWAPSEDLWMHGYWVWDWRDAYQRAARIDTLTRTIFPAEPHHHYGYQQGQRYYYLNVLEELDAPGEWALDSRRGVLYFWPPATLHTGDVTVSILNEPMIRLENARHVQLHNLILEGSRACAVKVRGGSDNLVAGCIIRNIDNDTCVVIDGGTRNGIRSCNVYDVGGTGIRIVGGDRRTLTPAANYATNNHITRYGSIVHAFNGGVFVQGVGNIVSHNRIHDAPFSGIQYYGNDHVIECNELYDLAHESGDVGGINTGADYSDMGTIIRYNYIHDTHGYGEGGFRGIYLDLPGSNTTIFGNILSNVDIGVFFNSGRDNVVANNIFVNCHPSVNIYVWPHMSYFRPGGAWKIVEKLQEIRYTEPPYSTRYPVLPRYLDSADLGKPYGNRVLNNISLGGTWLDLSEGMDFSHVRVEDNVIADTMLLVYTRKWFENYDPYHIGYASTHSIHDSSVVRELTQRGNLLVDPGIVNVRGGDFRISESSPAWRKGFTAIPLEKIGLVRDEFRKTLE